MFGSVCLTSDKQIVEGSIDIASETHLAEQSVSTWQVDEGDWEQVGRKNKSVITRMVRSTLVVLCLIQCIVGH